MSDKRLHPKAWVALVQTGLYSAADAICTTFVSVYLLITSNDLDVVCRFYLALFVMIPVFFVLAGWYSKVRDRLHAYRLALFLHAAFYALLLVLQEQAQHYDILLGALLGAIWGIYWAGANTIAYDVTSKGRREYFFGLLSVFSNLFRTVAPLLGGFLVHYADDQQTGYQYLFAMIVVLYLISGGLSFLLPSDSDSQPFRLKRALVAGEGLRDWRYVMLASASLAGSYHIFTILLGLFMYIETQNEAVVGGFAAYQAIVVIVVSYLAGRVMRPETRKKYLFIGAVLLAGSGFIFLLPITTWSLVAFGFMRSLSLSLFSIAHFSLRMDIISDSVLDNGERIEFLTAWEIPLAIGRVTMLGTLLILSNWLSENGLGIRIALFLLCAIRLVTYWLLAQTSQVSDSAAAEAKA